MEESKKNFRIELENVVEPSLLAFDNKTKGAVMTFEVQIMPLSPSQTRLRTVLDIRARSLPARLVLQSMRLVRPRINGRIDAALRKLATRIEAET